MGPSSRGHRERSVKTALQNRQDSQRNTITRHLLVESSDSSVFLLFAEIGSGYKFIVEYEAFENEPLITKLKYKNINTFTFA